MITSEDAVALVEVEPTLEKTTADNNGFKSAFEQKALSIRPVTQYLPDSDDSSVPEPTFIAARPTEVPVYEPLAFNEIVDQKYRIDALLGPVNRMNAYLVSPIDFNPPWCGQCGADIKEFDEFCDHCGLDLAQNRFLMLEGDRQLTTGFKILLAREFKNEGLLPIFDRFNFKDRFYVIAAKWDGETLASANMADSISLLNWILVLGNALETLHQNGFYNFNLTQESIFLRPDGPKIAGIGKCKNLSERKENSKKIQKNRRRDMLAFSRLLQQMLTRLYIPQNGKGLFSIVRELTHRLLRGHFENLTQFMDELRDLKKESIQTPLRGRSSQTRQISDQGMKLLVGKSSDCGEIRKLNEDSVATFEFTSITESVARPISLCVVADGMGGHQNGEIASRLAIQYIAEYVNQEILTLGLKDLEIKLNESEVKRILTEALSLANEKVAQIARAKQSDMGATIAIALIANETAFVLNVGDCRTYHYNGKQLGLLSEDHSLVYRLYKNNQIDYDEMFTHPQRNQILRCLGENDLLNKLISMQMQLNHPFWFTQKLERDDALILCSDGLWEMVPEPVIIDVLHEYSTPQSACDTLVRLANQHGGEDNISVIAVKLI